MEIQAADPDKLIQKEMTSSDYYWNSYAHFGIHEEMLKDQVRTLGYRRAILQNKHLFKDKIVLDVGCGTGILSMFAAQAGATHVYAVDSSDIIHQATQIVKDNGLDKQITCIQGKMEDVALPCDKVDIIISEWMGYFLLYESMLPTVLKARDKWLKPGGLIFPDQANIFVACIEDADYKEEKIEYWNNVYGFNFSCIQGMAYREPLVDTVNAESIITTPHKILALDLNTCKVEDLTFSSEFFLNVQRNDFVHAIIAWFDITFACCHKPVYFSTGPQSKYTHWKQTVFYLKDTLSVVAGDKISGKISVAPNNKNERDLDISIALDFDGKFQQVHKTQDYVLR
jgi:type I protein arginine methyltransferase